MVQFNLPQNSKVKKLIELSLQLEGLNRNIDVLLDDVDENMSQKFKKHDLIGIPYQIIVGSKSTNNKIEFKEVNSESSFIDLKDIKSKLEN